jgi:hypothetical protein
MIILIGTKQYLVSRSACSRCQVLVRVKDMVQMPDYKFDLLGVPVRTLIGFSIATALSILSGNVLI